MAIDWKPAVTFETNGSGRKFIRRTVGRTTQGVYWEFKIENVDGCFFYLDKVEILTINLSRGRMSG